MHHIIFTTINAASKILPQTIEYIIDENNDEKSLVDLDSFLSSKQLGSTIENGKTIFRLFTPSALKVTLCTFNTPEETTPKEYDMEKDPDGVWEVVLEGELRGLYYGYKVYHIGDNLRSKDQVISIDPYAKAVTTFNTYKNPRRAIVYDEQYDWEGDEWIQRDWRDLIIYEMHIRDMTKHPSSGAENPGTYKGLIETGKRGGIDYLKNLGINTVELLPAQEFGNIEIPYEDSLKGQFNTWNPYERNHWGYMTAAFFAPESYYSENWDTLEWNVWMGKSGDQVKEFKNMVKAFHREGIGVMMDVVYNHLSEYEVGNLKEIDKEYYFRLDQKGNFIAQSYCGNDLKTERPMMRRLIVDSILHWMKEYHVDGFRFDLGKLLDWTTIEVIIREARKINPNVIFVCEPWGGGYDPKGFSLRDWGAWNDQIRNGIKGENPLNGLGWIFGEWYGNNDIDRIKSYVNGTLVKDKNGLFQKKEHSVNYLESHDGYTLGDFIRIGTKEVDPEKKIENVEEHTKLSPLQMKLNKLAALFLFTSQGITMIHSGQEFARSKVIPLDVTVEDTHRGMIDHNTYNKDNEVNYINYEHADINNELLDYYKGLINLRNTFEAFRKAEYDKIKFHEKIENPFAFAYTLEYGNDTFFVMFNAHQHMSANFDLPSGEWEILVNSDAAGTESQGVKQSIYKASNISGAVLRKVR
jgi:pullulanase